MKVKTSINEILAVIFLFLIEIMYGFNYTSLEITGLLHDVLLYSAVLVGLVGFIARKMNLRQFILNTILLGVGVLVFLSSKETIFMLMVLSALVCQSIGYDIILKCIFGVRAITFFIIELLVLVGTLPFEVFTVSKGIFGTEIGYSFGYMHPNVLGQEIFFLITLYLAIRAEKVKNIELAVLLLVDLITFIFTRSKTSCGLLFLVIISTFLLKKNKFKARNIKLVKILISIIFILILFIGVGLPFIYSNASGRLQLIAWNLNGLLNGRLSHASTLFRSFNLTLFGEILDLNYIQSTYGYSVIDNSWVYTLFNFGPVAFVCLVALYYFSIKRLIDKRKFVFILIIIAFLVMGLMENVLRSMYMNFAVIFWKEVIEDKQKYIILNNNYNNYLERESND